jgi:hypothetical protein
LFATERTPRIWKALRRVRTIMITRPSCPPVPQRRMIGGRTDHTLDRKVAIKGPGQHVLTLWRARHIEPPYQVRRHSTSAGGGAVARVPSRPKGQPPANRMRRCAAGISIGFRRLRRLHLSLAKIPGPVLAPKPTIKDPLHQEIRQGTPVLHRAAHLGHWVFGSVNRKPPAGAPAIQAEALMLLAGRTSRTVRARTSTAAKAQYAENRRPQVRRLALQPANHIGR